MCEERLILFTRYPEPGKVKTRLIKHLGPQGSAALHRRLAEGTLDVIRDLLGRREVGVEIRFDGGDPELMEQWLGSNWRFCPQGGGDLGARMERAIAGAFEGGFTSAIMIGTDCPGLSAERIKIAFEALRRCDLILGPALDGGYYLIGLARPVPELFRDVPWGSNRVLSKTKEIASRLGLRVREMEPLSDIDRPEDLPQTSHRNLTNNKGLLNAEDCHGE